MTTESDAHFDSGFALRFAAIGFLMVMANLIPYVLTLGAFKTDGLEIAGFPIRFYSFGGPSPVVEFSVWAMIGNFVIAFLVAAGGAYLFRNGFKTTLRRWQTWGTPFAR